MLAIEVHRFQWELIQPHFTKETPLRFQWSQGAHNIFSAGQGHRFQIIVFVQSTGKEASWLFEDGKDSTMISMV